MKITVFVEGATELAIAPSLRAYLRNRMRQDMPKLDFLPYNGRIPKGDKLRTQVQKLLGGNSPSDHVIALTDVYTGTQDFSDSEDAKMKMRAWVGDEPRFTPHVALHDFEAWLLPYWSDIQKLAKHNKSSPAPNPETVNHSKPPAKHIEEIFRVGNSTRHYLKTRDAKAILAGKDLGIAISQCSELKSFDNTIIRLSGGTEIA